MTTFWHALSGAVLVGFAALALGSGGKKKDDTGAGTTTSAASAKIGDTVTFDDSTWVVVSVKSLGQTLKLEYAQPKKTEGQFILVQYKVTNTQKKDDSVLESCKLLDAKGREFGPIPDEALYVGEGKKTMMLEQLPPSMTKEFWTIFEVPSDATGLKFQARSLGPLPDKKTVDLGAIPVAAPSPVSSAPSTPAATAHPAAAHPTGTGSAKKK
jgi:hypothetical protein